MRLTAVLLLLMWGAHYLFKSLAWSYPDPVFAAKAIFYAVGGLERSVLYFLVWLLGYMVVSKPARIPLTLCCLWGVVEGLQIAVCRAAWGFQNAVPNKPIDGLCDSLTGLPLYSLGLAAFAFIAALLAFQIRDNHGSRTH